MCVFRLYHEFWFNFRHQRTIKIQIFVFYAYPMVHAAAFILNLIMRNSKSFSFNRIMNIIYTKLYTFMNIISHDDININIHLVWARYGHLYTSQQPLFLFLSSSRSLCVCVWMCLRCTRTFIANVAQIAQKNVYIYFTM